MKFSRSASVSLIYDKSIHYDIAFLRGNETLPRYYKWANISGHSRSRLLLALYHMKLESANQYDVTFVDRLKEGQRV